MPANLEFSSEVHPGKKNFLFLYLSVLNMCEHGGLNFERCIPPNLLFAGRNFPTLSRCTIMVKLG